jgi:putative membrane protein
MVLVTLYHAVRGQFDKHRRNARWTWPIWMYVSVTGVLIYLLLYQIFEQPR